MRSSSRKKKSTPADPIVIHILRRKVLMPSGGSFTRSIQFVQRKPTAQTAEQNHANKWEQKAMGGHVDSPVVIRLEEAARVAASSQSYRTQIYTATGSPTLTLTGVSQL